MNKENIKRVLIAIDSFKESISSQEAADVIEKRLKIDNPDLLVEKVPIADGGEGTVASIIKSVGGRIIKTRVHDPLMRIIDAEYGILPDDKTAVIEMAQASGLTLLNQNERNPLWTNTFGTGQLIFDAAKKDCESILIGIGGSATNDGGQGLATALGIRFFDKDKKSIGCNNDELIKLYSIDVSKKLLSDKIKITILCDVQNQLLGANGATFVYGKQKGATPEMLQKMESNLKHYARIVEQTIGIELKNHFGMGAAGGIAFSLAAFFNARLVTGIDFINKTLKIEEKIQAADLIITGEGRLDDQSFFNKGPIGISRLAKKYNKKVIAVVGVEEASASLKNEYFDKVFSLVEEFNITSAESIKNAGFYLDLISDKLLNY